MQLVCKHHGVTYHRLSSVGKNRPKKHVCARCIIIRQMRVRHRKKQVLVNENGGGCKLCGYKKWTSAIDFHHVNPEEKAFGLGKGNYRSIEACRAEAAKCIPLCKNCHAEYETGCPETITKLDEILATRLVWFPEHR